MKEIAITKGNEETINAFLRYKGEFNMDFKDIEDAVKRARDRLSEIGMQHNTAIAVFCTNSSKVVKLIKGRRGGFKLFEISDAVSRPQYGLEIYVGEKNVMEGLVRLENVSGFSIRLVAKAFVSLLQNRNPISPQYYEVQEAWNILLAGFIEHNDSNPTVESALNNLKVALGLSKEE